VYMGEWPLGVDRPGLQSDTNTFGLRSETHLLGLQSATKRLTALQASPRNLLRRAA
jgi:hypothetical protein